MTLKMKLIQHSLIKLTKSSYTAVYFEPYGCTMNYGETRRMVDLVNSSSEFKVVDNIESADVIVIVTCTVVQATENKMLKRLRAFAMLNKPVIVAGCMASAQPQLVRNVLPRAVLLPPQKINEICNIIRTLNLWNITSQVSRGTVTDKVGIWSKNNHWRADPTRRTDAIVPIAQGCLGTCSYCITRLARGRLKSYPMDYIVAEVNKFIRAGYREIQLTAQDTCAYGRDNGTTVAELLNTLSKLPGKFKLRVGMMNPDTLLPILDQVIDAYRDAHVFKFLHLPVQSGADNILTLMNRKYSAAEFKHIIDKFRTVFPTLTLSTDVIVGFPGETEAEFQSTVELLTAVQPNIVNIKAYSPRGNTKASKLSGKLPNWIIKVRTRALTKLRFQLSLNLNLRLVGSVQYVLVTECGKPGTDTMICRTDDYNPVVIREHVNVGTFGAATITDATDCYLIGKFN